MENAVSNITPGQLVIPGVESTYATTKAVDDVVSSAFLPYLTLNTANSDSVKNDKAQMNTWSLVRGQTFLDLGKKFDCWPLKWRPKAVDSSDDKKPMITVFDPSHDEFKRIKAENIARPSEMAGYLFGLEFLIWVPKYQTFAAYFASSKTARTEFQYLAAPGAIGKPMTFSGSWYENTKFKWYGPQLMACSVPFEAYPTQEQMDAEIAKFTNTPPIVVAGGAEKISDQAPASGEGGRER